MPAQEVTSDREMVLARVDKVIVHPDEVCIQFKAIYHLPAGDIAIPAKLFRGGKEMKLDVPPEHDDRANQQDPALIQLVVRAQMARAAPEQSNDMTIEALASQPD